MTSDPVHDRLFAAEKDSKDHLDSLLKEKGDKLGIDAATEPVPVDPEDAEIIDTTDEHHDAQLQTQVHDAIEWGVSPVDEVVEDSV
ncbi:hypothetical protein QEH68_01335 [Paenarthrobacter sp. OM7]|uniref:Uncharacterized protein n=1 Tax=Paenarthrobacter sp. AMU7 TaxID=3162492 RepID=A0AB39YPT7_9MICC|nr:hypothetical protein [Paenarthrobacter sp. OM7]WGM20861.1 hypothetical protein QEH68_01335 [Paenarthrobacter sp. OM7]